MLTDRKRIQALLDELEQEHTVQELDWSSNKQESSNTDINSSDRPTPAEQHDGGLTSETSDSVLDRILDDEESIDEKETPWVNKEKFPGVTVVND